MEELRLGRRIVYDVKANWKLIIQNYNECLHCPNLHPALNQLSHYLSGENEPLNAAYMGGRMDLRPGVETLSVDGMCRRARLPDLSPDDRRRVYYYAIFPNLLLSLHPDYMMVHTLWPIAPDRTVNVCEWHFHPSELARPDFDASDAIDFWDMTNRQDWHVCELSQAGIASRAYTPGPYSNQKICVRVRPDDRGAARARGDSLLRTSLPRTPACPSALPSPDRYRGSSSRLPTDARRSAKSSARTRSECCGERTPHDSRWRPCSTSMCSSTSAADGSCRPSMKTLRRRKPDQGRPRRTGYSFRQSERRSPEGTGDQRT